MRMEHSRVIQRVDGLRTGIIKIIVKKQHKMKQNQLLDLKKKSSLINKNKSQKHVE